MANGSGRFNLRDAFRGSTGLQNPFLTFASLNALGGGPIVGAAKNFLSSPFGGFLAQLPALQQQHEEQERVQGLSEADIRRGQQLLNSAVGSAGALSSQGIGLAQEQFDPQRAGERFREGVLQPFLRSQRQTTQGFGAGSELIQQGFQQRADDISGRFDRLAQRAMGEVSSLTDQRRRDIQRRFGEVGASRQADLAARGFSGSSAAAVTEGVTERERSGALNRLTDQEINERLNVLGTFGTQALQARSQLTGESLGAQERLLGFGTGLAQEQALNRANLTQSGFDFMNFARQAQLDNMFNFGQLPINTKLGAAGQFFGIQRIPPESFRPAQLLPSFSSLQ